MTTADPREILALARTQMNRDPIDLVLPEGIDPADVEVSSLPCVDDISYSYRLSFDVTADQASQLLIAAGRDTDIEKMAEVISVTSTLGLRQLDLASVPDGSRYSGATADGPGGRGTLTFVFEGPDYTRMHIGIYAYSR